jgi:hypothetical protein
MQEIYSLEIWIFSTRQQKLNTGFKVSFIINTLYVFEKIDAIINMIIKLIKVLITH